MQNRNIGNDAYVMFGWYLYCIIKIQKFSINIKQGIEFNKKCKNLAYLDFPKIKYN